MCIRAVSSTATRVVGAENRMPITCHACSSSSRCTSYRRRYLKLFQRVFWKRCMPHLSRTSPLWMFTTSLLLMALSSPSPLGRLASAEQDDHQQLSCLLWMPLGRVFVISASRCILPLQVWHAACTVQGLHGCHWPVVAKWCSCGQACYIHH